MSIGFAPNATGNLMPGPVCVSCGDTAAPGPPPVATSPGSCGPTGCGWCCADCSVSDPNCCDPCYAIGQFCCKLHPYALCCIAGCCDFGGCSLPTGPYFFFVDCRTAGAPSGNYVSGLTVSCDETGQVYQYMPCAYVTFNYLYPTTYHLSTPGGPGQICVSHGPNEIYQPLLHVPHDVLVPPDFIDLIPHT